MKWLDKFSENSARSVARQSSRRGFIAKVGTMMLGGAAIPLLPVARAGGNLDKFDPDPAGQVAAGFVFTRRQRGRDARSHNGARSGKTSQPS